MMGNFSLGLMVGAVVGIGVMVTVHPMNKRAMRKACHRAERIMNKMNDRLHDFTC